MHLSVRWGKAPNYSHNRLLQCKIAFSGEMWLTVVYISSDSIGINVPPVSERNVPPSAERNVPLVSD